MLSPSSYSLSEPDPEWDTPAVRPQGLCFTFCCSGLKQGHLGLLLPSPQCQWSASHGDCPEPRMWMKRPLILLTGPLLRVPGRMRAKGAEPWQSRGEKGLSSLRRAGPAPLGRGLHTDVPVDAQGRPAGQWPAPSASP